MKRELTGRWCLMQETTKSGFWGQITTNRLVLMVEEKRLETELVAGHIESEWRVRWRRATVPDIGALNIPMGVFK